MAEGATCTREGACTCSRPTCAHVMFTSHVGREGATCWTVDVLNLKEQHVGREHVALLRPTFGRVALS